MRAPQLSVILQNGQTFVSPGLDQIFEFTPADGEDRVTISVPRLALLRIEKPEAFETIAVPIRDLDTKLLVETRGIDFDRVMSINIARAFEPGFAVFMRNGSFLVVDGNHRYVWRSLSGLQSMDFHTCRYPDWEAALIDIPATKRLWKGQIR